MKTSDFGFSFTAATGFPACASHPRRWRLPGFLLSFCSRIHPPQLQENRWNMTQPPPPSASNRSHLYRKMKNPRHSRPRLSSFSHKRFSGGPGTRSFFGVRPPGCRLSSARTRKACHPIPAVVAARWAVFLPRTIARSARHSLLTFHYHFPLLVLVRAQSFHLCMQSSSRTAIGLARSADQLKRSLTRKFYLDCS